MKKFSRMRQDMVETQIIARGIRDKNIIAAFLKVPREEICSRAFYGLCV
ncbi:MAG: hypothetical protein ACOX1Z_04620 [Candidatus Ratteibacteria bacterium]